ncbi:MAG: hypothetical protein Q8N17_20075 [Burkholderiaceae bacterium]|nr:hypothetical protein [Burkholderiaceae bacterium]
MRVIEADAKRMLWRRGLAVPEGARLYRAGDAVSDPGGAVAVKAQVLHGSRADAGLVELAQQAQAAAAVERVSRAMAVTGAAPLVLLERQVRIDAEYYVAWRIDDLRQQAVMLFSAAGGTGIESRSASIQEYGQPPRAQLQPHHLLEFLKTCGVPTPQVGVVARFCVDLYHAFTQEDALLLEINPLAITDKGRAVAVDAKLVLDDNAAPRHLDWAELASSALQETDATRLESAAAQAGFTFVELQGRVAVFSAGAGLGMCLLDVLADAGMPAANFSDATGGGGVDKWADMAQIVFERAQRPDVDAILFFFVLTATSIKSVLSGLFRLIDAAPPPKPLVVGLACAGAAEKEMTFAQAQEEFRRRGHECVTDMSEAVAALQAVVAQAGKRGA